MSNHASVLESADKAQAPQENQEMKLSQAGVAADNQAGAGQMAKLRENFGACELTDNGLPSLLLVAKEIASGAMDEVVNHPGRVLGNVAIGAAVGVGAALVAPEVAIGAAVVGAGYAAYEVYQNASDWWNSAKIVADPTGKSAAEQKQAKETLNNLGGAATDIVAGGIGGATAAIGTAVIKNTVVETVSTVGQAMTDVVAAFMRQPSPTLTVELTSPAARATAAGAVTSGVTAASREIQSW